ncbi:putative iron-sulfur cluster-binding metallochaperone [Trichothermofontia sp.]
MNCPHDRSQGKPVKVLTLKSLLVPQALERLNSQVDYQFCSSANCSIVYFSAEGDTFTTSDLKVPVFQKDPAKEVPVCYCFGWTRQRIQAIDESFSIVDSITKHIQAGRCGCEVNNPEGKCCLKNIRDYASQGEEPSPNSTA